MLFSRLHEGAAPLPPHDPALHHEFADGLPNRGAAYLEFGGQLVFGKQPAADGIDSVVDSLPENARYLVVERERLRIIDHRITYGSLGACIGENPALSPPWLTFWVILRQRHLGAM